ncbi:MAG: hydantoinase B/oxoprolinase family protein [Thiotrichales bacterium]
MSAIDPISLNLFARRVDAICEEMGAKLMRAAFSPNIRDRRDFSCALFDVRGELLAQAAHIPVHLGSMAYAMRDIVNAVAWAPGDQLILNDPFLGGTHLPDVTLVAPVYATGALAGFVANRAHYADIGSATPGSMPLAERLEDEGLLIPPQKVVEAGAPVAAVITRLARATRNPRDTLGDLNAQLACNRVGAERLQALLSRMGLAGFERAGLALNDYAERLTRALLAQLPAGRFVFEDVLEDDGFGHRDLPLRVSIEVVPDGLRVDFTGSAPQTRGNVNCPLAVTVAGVWYVIRCLLPAQTPACAGVLRPIQLHVPVGSILNACRPAAVAAGNVETSTRVVDVMLGALAPALPARIPAASQGSMNNLALGADGVSPWSYYETLAGGAGGGPAADGLDAVQSHMTNTRNTPIEVLEARYPLRVRRYALRSGSGGAGLRRGGDGLVREFEFLEAATVTLLTERRRHAPWGLAGGTAGAPGRNLLNGRTLPAKCQISVSPGDLVSVETPGGGGWGEPGQTTEKI